MEYAIISKQTGANLNSLLSSIPSAFGSKVMAMAWFASMGLSNDEYSVVEVK